MNHARNREQQMIKELHRELQHEKHKVVEVEKIIENEALRANTLSMELEAIRAETVSEVQLEKAKFTELKTALEVERSRCQELKTAFQREQVLNAQLQATMEQERQQRELERQKQRDLELKNQLDQQKIGSLEEQVEDWKNHAQKTLEELQKLQDKQKFDQEEDVEMQRELEMELQKSLERHSPAGRESGSSGQRSRLPLIKEQLEAIRQRLQLITVKEQEGLALLRRLNQTVSDRSSSSSSTAAHEMHILERNLQEATAELKQIHGSLVLQTETSTGVPGKSRLNSRLLNQNAELSDYITKLSEEKSEMRRQLSQLEEQLWSLKQRQLQQSSSPPRGSRRDMDSLFAEERSSWERERLSTQNALRQAEREIIRLKLELEQNASNRESDAELLLSNGDIPENQQRKFQRLYGKYLRAESFRKSLIYQKKYLLLVLGNFQDTEETSLALIAKMGGYPNPTNIEEGSRHSKAFTKFRSAVRVCIAISRLKYLKKKWQRACGSSTSQSLPAHIIPSYRSSLPPVHHSSTSGATSVPPPFLSPGRVSPRFRGASSESPPVRDKVVPGAPPYRSSSHSRARERLSMSPNDPMEDPEVSLTKYIRKLENLQERIGSGYKRGEQNGSRRQPPSQRR